MKTENNPVAVNERIILVDALRGFSLLGILFAHATSGFDAIFPESAPDSFTYIPDMIVSIINGFLVSGKFFMIFSFLFGLSFFIQMDRAARKGYNFRWRFLWRVIILLVIGFIHGLLFSGDILIIFAILGIPLVFMYKVNDQWLIFMFILLMCGAPRFAWFGYQKIEKGISQHYKIKTDEKSVSMQEMMDQIQEIARKATFIRMVEFNLKEGLTGKADFQLGLMGRAYQTMALFLLGLLAGRHRYFENIREKYTVTKTLLKRAVIVCIGSLLLMAISAYLSWDDFRQLSESGSLNSWCSRLAISFYDTFNFGLSAIIVFGFVILFQKQKIGQKLLKLAPYGRMALTNYILQSVVFVPLFFGWGFGLIDSFGPFTSLVPLTILFILQVKFSQWWLSGYYYGPFEWLWRSATYLKWQPFKKYFPQ